ncbi:MAG: NADH-quinone oxidoreductase subunit NuoH [Candidatus Syntropharchaeia archaeon]
MTMYDILTGFLKQIHVYSMMESILGSTGVEWILLFIIAGIVATIASLILAYCTWLERKVFGDIQNRLGPMLVGFHGLLQPIADGIKLLHKEDIIAKKADRWVFILAPVVMFVPVVILLAFIPFGDGLVMTDLDVSVILLLAISSLPTLGIVMAGWASNNKYSLISALRRAAEIISYEVSLVLCVVGIVLLAGSMSMCAIVKAQDPIPFIILQPIGFFVFFVGGLAELGRIPFDFPECESELVAGYMTEYSGMKFSFFMLAEYLELFVLSAIITALYLGGGNGPFLPSPVWFGIKTFVFIWIMIWIRATLPRVRIDQLLNIGWKLLLPLALINIPVTVGIMYIL